MKIADNSTYQIVNAMLRRGNKPGLLREWFDGLLAWAEANSGPDAAALRAWLKMAKPRPFYTSGELATMWPAFKLAVKLAPRMQEPPSANRLTNELLFHGLPLLRSSENSGNTFAGPTGGVSKYFIVERCHYWRDRPLSQEEFENALLD